MSGAQGGRGRSIVAWLLPASVLGLCVLYLGSALRPPKEEGFQLSRFGRLPVVDQGRIKPIDTLARIGLMVLSNKQTMWLDGVRGTSDRDEVDNHVKIPAVHWLLDVMTRPERARQYTVVRIDHPDVLSLIDAERGRKYFSIDEILSHRQSLAEQIDRARAVPANELTPFQRQLLRLSQKLEVYFSAEDVMHLLLVPPPSEDDAEPWQALADAQHRLESHGEPTPAAEVYTTTLQAWLQNDPQTFNATVSAYAATLEDQLPGRMSKVRFEVFFSRSAPFIHAMVLYVLVFILAALSWLRLSRPLSRSALWVLVLTLAVHTVGLIARVHIQGRPPVTNLYSSAIFVGWGSVVLGAVLERIYRNGIGAVTAAGTGFLTLLIAHNLSLDGDTMTMMQAVLDTNFWLATHVVVITLGYASTFLAGFLAVVYILRGVLTTGLRREDARNLSRMIYGIICFATLFSFVGTILGGIWADQSWGRFWGWDPKENGALLIVLWNAMILHARWGGMAKQRGIALLAIGGNIVTSWSWFGTNMLGVGLHAYGFIDSAVFWMLMFVASQLLLIGLGMLPQQYWRSMRALAPGTGQPAGDLRAPLPQPGPAKGS
ncbi:MAG: cytochrome c biogenesis protein [Candidatus Krumholzibacteriia bacterium]